MTEGRIHSIQSLGTVDGPGVRFTVFLQGCNLRCSCCHNPDTWDTEGGTLCSSVELFNKCIRFKEYFGKDGGLTFSGGEPLMQPDYVREVFKMCHENGINTCLDTSGCLLDRKTEQLLEQTDRVLLDIKYTDDNNYRKHVGCGIETPMKFLAYLNTKAIPTTIRHVVIPTINDSEDSLLKLKKIANDHRCVDKIELLPFRKLCTVKYDNMGLTFPFADRPEPSKEEMTYYESLIKGFQIREY